LPTLASRVPSFIATANPASLSLSHCFYSTSAAFVFLRVVLSFGPAPFLRSYLLVQIEIRHLLFAFRRLRSTSNRELSAADPSHFLSDADHSQHSSGDRKTQPNLTNCCRTFGHLPQPSLTSLELLLSFKTSMSLDTFLSDPLWKKTAGERSKGHLELLA
jgi:hypothetical protein